MADGFTALFNGIADILGSFFSMQFLGTNIGLLLIAFGVTGMVIGFIVRRFLHE